ncbi:MAG TPA: alanine racemase [Caulobacteraceae bacterium]|nr:alanine racemase [Caulobacteraceae bacterium]
MSFKRRSNRARRIAGGVWALATRPRSRAEGGHDAYFASLQAALAQAGVAEPALVIDRARLRENVAAVRKALSPSGLALRVVSKSLQSPALLDAVLAGTGAERLMTFNGVMLDEIVRVHPELDVLLGRPLPAGQVGAFVQRQGNNSARAARPQWLVDSPARLAQYAEIARDRAQAMRVNLEIDVGLHRGGLPDLQALAETLDLAAANPLIEVTGLMGYDAHVPGFAEPKAEMARVQARYRAAKAVLTARLGGDPSRFTLNAAGSPTFMAHVKGSEANEVSIGSAFVKPANYDYGALHALKPAAFIAQPVLKVMDPPTIPGLERYASTFGRLNPDAQRGYFVYGGYGDAEPVSPPGLSWHPLFGSRSMLMASRKVALEKDDTVFFRPRESEGVFLQYGDLLVFDNGAIVDRWPTFAVAA